MGSTSRRFLFRIDASSKFGLGHLRRTLALANVLHENGHACSYIIADGGETLPLELPFPRVEAPGSSQWDFVLIDSYTISPEDIRVLFSAAKTRVWIADGVDPAVDCDVILDHNLYANPSIYAARGGKRTTLVGPEYAMISREILEAREKGYEVSPRIRKVLLTLGGSDLQQSIRSLLNGITMAAHDVEVIVVRVRDKGHEVLPPVLSNHCHCVTVTAPSNIGLLMRDVDLAISGGGVTSLELACIGVPAIYVALAENQKRGAEAAKSLGIGEYLGEQGQGETENFSRLYHFLENAEVRRDMSQRARKVVDGHGPVRIRTALEQMMCDKMRKPLRAKRSGHRTSDGNASSFRSSQGT